MRWVEIWVEKLELFYQEEKVCHRFQKLLNCEIHSEDLTKNHIAALEV